MSSFFSLGSPTCVVAQVLVKTTFPRSVAFTASITTMNPMIFDLDDDGLALDTAAAPAADGGRPDSPLDFRIIGRGRAATHNQDAATGANAPADPPSPPPINRVALVPYKGPFVLSCARFPTPDLQKEATRMQQATNRLFHDNSVTVTARTNNLLWVEDIIDLVEQEASSALYGLLKRPDEKWVTERAYENPKFVEDMVRDIAAKLNQESRVDAYVVESENFESIHNHSAYALIQNDKRLK